MKRIDHRGSGTTETYRDDIDEPGFNNAPPARSNRPHPHRNTKRTSLYVICRLQQLRIVVEVVQTVLSTIGIGGVIMSIFRSLSRIGLTWFVDHQFRVA